MIKFSRDNRASDKKYEGLTGPHEGFRGNKIKKSNH